MSLRTARFESDESGEREAAVRAGEARRAAADEVARSERLVAGTVLHRDRQAFAHRCAWCERIRLGSQWVPPDELPPFVSTIVAAYEARVTHTICPTCFAAEERKAGR